MQKRTYVKVSSVFDAAGYVTPTAITWKDGRVFKIDRVLGYRSGTGVFDKTGCFTVVIRGKARKLYFERTDRIFHCTVARWFVTTPDAQDTLSA